MNRRKFMHMLGVGAVAGPKLAQETLAATAGRDLGSGGFGVPYFGASGVGPPSQLLENTRKIPLSAARFMGAPAWLKDAWHEQSYSAPVTLLDPDLASFRSWSLAAKIAAQRDRNFHAQEAAFWAYGERSMAQTLWQKTFGRFEWWN